MLPYDHDHIVQPQYVPEIKIIKLKKNNIHKKKD